MFGKALKAIIFSIKQVNLKQIIVPNYNSEQKHNLWWKERSWNNALQLVKWKKKTGTFLPVCLVTITNGFQQLASIYHKEEI